MLHSIFWIFIKCHHSIENYTVGITLHPPILALDYVTHLVVIKGWVGRYNNDGVEEGDRDGGATCTKN